MRSAMIAAALAILVAGTSEAIPPEAGEPAYRLAQGTGIFPGTGVPGTGLPPGSMPGDNRAQCRQRCYDRWEANRQFCLSLTGGETVRQCLEEIIATRDACYANC